MQSCLASRYMPIFTEELQIVLSSVSQQINEKEWCWYGRAKVGPAPELSEDIIDEQQ